MAVMNRPANLSTLPRHFVSAQGSYAEELKAGCLDVVNSLRSYRIWVVLGLNDVAARYRGSILGPFWITLTTSVFVLGIGLLYAGLMKVSADRYLPWMATGVVIWGLISQTLQESADSLISAGNALRQTSLPVPLFVWRVVWRNVLTFCHQLPVLIAVGAWYHYLTHMNIPLAVAGLGLIVINLAWMALTIGIAAARFRDLQQVLASVIQLMFFFSPILWLPSDVHGYTGKLVQLNPVVHMMNVVRGPLLAQGFSRFSTLYLLVMALGGWIFTLILFSRVRRRIVHYI